MGVRSGTARGPGGPPPAARRSPWRYVAVGPDGPHRTGVQFQDVPNDDEIEAVTVGGPVRHDAPIDLPATTRTGRPATSGRRPGSGPRSGDRTVVLEHTGSTSVPGLAAKSIIDITMAVPDSSDEAAYVPDLEAAGYELRIREPDWFEHRLFKGPDTEHQPPRVRRRLPRDRPHAGLPGPPTRGRGADRVLLRAARSGNWPGARGPTSSTTPTRSPTSSPTSCRGRCPEAAAGSGLMVSIRMRQCWRVIFCQGLAGPRPEAGRGRDRAQIARRSGCGRGPAPHGGRRLRHQLRWSPGLSPDRPFRSSVPSASPRRPGRVRRGPTSR